MRDEMGAAHLLDPAQHEADRETGQPCVKRLAAIVRQPEHGDRDQPHADTGMAGREAIAHLHAGRDGVEDAQQGFAAGLAID